MTKHRTHFSDHAPNRNPCESSFRCVDRRLSHEQYESMNHVDSYYGIDSYYVNNDKTVSICTLDGDSITIIRNGTIHYNNFS